MMNKQKKQEIIEGFRMNAKDTGSLEVQVALMTERIHTLNKHFQAFPKEKASRTGLMKLVGRRRTYLDYLKKHNETSYDKLIKALDIRK